MANLQFPANPTSYRRTAWQLILMMLMGVNYLLDHDPRHVQYGKTQRAQRQAAKHHCNVGIVSDSHPDDDEHAKRTSHAASAHATRSTPVPNASPDNSHRIPPPVSRNGKEAWPYPRDSFLHSADAIRPKDNDAPWSLRNAASGPQMRDAWMKMRTATRTKHVDMREKKVKFDNDVH